MSLSDAVPEGQPVKPIGDETTLPDRPEQPISRLARIIAQAPRFTGDPHRLNKGEHTALKRMNPDTLRPHQIAALMRALNFAEIEPSVETWPRWALIAHGMALAGHDPSNKRLGQHLSEAGVSESRVTKLLTSRGDAFRQLLPRLLRLLASKNVAPNWRELGGLVLNQDRDDEKEEKAESIRLKIARYYFSVKPTN